MTLETYGDIGKLGLNDSLDQRIGLWVDGGSRLVQKKDFAPTSEGSHEGDWTSAVRALLGMLTYAIASLRH